MKINKSDIDIRLALVAFFNRISDENIIKIFKQVKIDLFQIYLKFDAKCGP